MRINRYKVAVLAFGAMTMIGVTGMAARAMASPDSGDEQFHFVAGGNVSASGAFTASGTNSNTSKTTGVFDFPRGDITVTHTDDPGGSSSFNDDTCVGHFSGTGDYTIVSGNGIYENISGHGEFTVTGQSTTSKVDGKCTNHVVSQRVVVDASGPISFN